MLSSLVLVIEDQLLRRSNTTEILREAGYDVIEAEDAAIAPIGSEETSTGQPSGAALQMPWVRDGVGLALLLRRMYPHIKVILSSSVFARRDGARCTRFTPKSAHRARAGFAQDQLRQFYGLVH
jgi:CheY-like chemotaxis protein